MPSLFPLPDLKPTCCVLSLSEYMKAGVPQDLYLRLCLSGCVYKLNVLTNEKRGGLKVVAFR
jgi:hypothetical protein